MVVPGPILSALPILSPLFNLMYLTLATALVLDYRSIVWPDNPSPISFPLLQSLTSVLERFQFVVPNTDYYIKVSNTIKKLLMHMPHIPFGQAVCRHAPHSIRGGGPAS